MPALLVKQERKQLLSLTSERATCSWQVLVPLKVLVKIDFLEIIALKGCEGALNVVSFSDVITLSLFA